jgi:CheY-like chemotaxis protein
VTVLVVDDERPIMQLCVTVLEMHGHTVEGFTRGEELLARLAEAPPDLIIVDYKMPGMSGLDVVRRARARKADLRMLMITGHGTREVVAEATAAGVASVLLKPFTPNELARAVADVLAAAPRSA